MPDPVARVAGPLRGPHDLDPLIELVGDARYVLLGEASHGTSQFYTWRTAITQRLMRELGFTFVAVEGDWPDCARVDRFVRGLDPGRSAREVLQAFDRWPTWMWANHEVVHLVEWLRAHGGRFHGLDVYSLWDSLVRVLEWLREHCREGVARAIAALDCFEASGPDLERYALRAHWLDASCEDEVVRLLATVRAAAGGDPEDRFDAEQNALVVANAERYYRTLARGGPASWNVRDVHMADTLDRLMAHHGPRAKAVVWEHNTHVGDARYTDMARAGMVNLGQLVRERHEDEGVVLVGFASHEGTVVAARAWEAPMERMRVPPARAGSWDRLLHDVLGDDALLILRGEDHPDLLRVRGHRAIGVVYHPEHEGGNYVPTVLPRRYDALLYLDRTSALHPLHEVAAVEPTELPETFPTGM